MGLQSQKNDGNEERHEISEPPGPKRLKKKRDAAVTGSPRQETQHYASEKPVAASVVHNSIWKHYDKLFALQFGGGDYFTVAEKSAMNPEESPVIIVKRIAGNDRIKTIQKIQHERFVRAQEFFTAENAYFVAFEFMPLSIAEFMGHPLMNELRLASILGQVSDVALLMIPTDGMQVIDGLAYLERKSMQHGQLTCSNILVDSIGNVKLWGQEHCQVSSDMKADIRALGTITMELIQGYAKTDGNIGLDKLERWPRGMDFLAATECTSRVDALVEEVRSRICC
ncbi:hypothetical protein AARAC_010894 [Aspergillus arachidicola]|uniref:Serine-threonine/tyrosine-protein kinase catalytic domain-containing protein n=1 Tax=Aspergillus arachidicola TaxID=656916 RepID=A0A2G7FQ17_9EURO|nr:hypothetical protein AARAC_010894 [Aspergillus arachidicola]